MTTLTQKTEWHLDRRVNLSFVFAVILQTMAFTALITNMSKDIEVNSKLSPKVESLERSVYGIEPKLETLQGSVQRIERNVEKLTDND
jgi:hypothetical protein